MKKKSIKDYIKEQEKSVERLKKYVDLEEYENNKDYENLVFRVEKLLNEMKEEYEKEKSYISFKKFFNYFYMLIILSMFFQIIFVDRGLTFCISVYLLVILVVFCKRYLKYLSNYTVKDDFYYKIFWWFSIYCIVDFIISTGSFFSSIGLMNIYSLEFFINLLYIYLFKPIINALLTLCYIDMFLDVSGRGEIDEEDVKKYIKKIKSR